MAEADEVDAHALHQLDILAVKVIRHGRAVTCVFLVAVGAADE